MATAAELLATSDVLSIDVAKRAINIPKNLTLLGVTSDEDVQKLRFSMSRYYNGIDLSTHTIRINYENAQGEGDVYGATDIKVTTDNIEFTWVVSRHATMYAGNVKFTVCAVKTNGESEIVSEFNTIPTTLPVVEGLETDPTEDLEEYPDVIDAVARETLAKAKENGDFTPVKGEDYYTPEEAEAFGQMVVDNANGQFANSIKGVKSGEVIRVDDVSPIEHIVDCSVHGKNLMPLGTASFTKNKNFKFDVPLSAGTYTLSAVITSTDTDGETSAVSINSGNEVLKYLTLKRSERVSTTFTVNKPITNIDFCAAYNYSQGVDDTAEWTDIQIEEGPVATAYEPYVDPTTVTVTACGKNILSVTGQTTTQAGVTFTVNSNGSITVNGTATENTFYKIGKINLANCGQYHLSGSPANSGVTTSLLYIHDVESYVDVYDYGNGKTFTPTGGTCDVVIGVYKGYTANNLVYWPMVEAGTEKTEFEKFTKKTTYIPGTDGKCSVVSVSPIMTLFTNKAGVVVEAEYSRDTTKMFESYVLTDRAIGAIAAEIEDDMVEVLEALNSYAASLTGGVS